MLFIVYSREKANYATNLLPGSNQSQSLRTIVHSPPTGHSTILPSYHPEQFLQLNKSIKVEFQTQPINLKFSTYLGLKAP